MRNSDGLVGWGYEGKSLEDLLEQARHVGASTVIDVRLHAISRKRGFSKGRLSEALAAAGIQYRHMPALGNPRDNRAGFAHPDSAEGQLAHRRFTREVLDTRGAGAAVAELAELALQEVVMIMCYEADQHCCHRSLVLERAWQFL